MKFSSTHVPPLLVSASLERDAFSIRGKSGIPTAHGPVAFDPEIRIDVQFLEAHPTERSRAQGRDAAGLRAARGRYRESIRPDQRHSGDGGTVIRTSSLPGPPSLATTSRSSSWSRRREWVIKALSIRGLSGLYETPNRPRCAVSRHESVGETENSAQTSLSSAGLALNSISLSAWMDSWALSPLSIVMCLSLRLASARRYLP